jgi:hypothetical protein
MACCDGFFCAAGSWLAGTGPPLLLLLLLLLRLLSPLVDVLPALLRCCLAAPLLSAACRTPWFTRVFDFCCCWCRSWCCCWSLSGCVAVELLLVVSELLPLPLSFFFVSLLDLCLRLGQASLVAWVSWQLMPTSTLSLLFPWCLDTVVCLTRCCCCCDCDAVGVKVAGSAAADVGAAGPAAGCCCSASSIVAQRTTLCSALLLSMLSNQHLPFLQADSDSRE